MESKTYIKNIKISPKKLRFLLPAIKKQTPAKALNYLMYTPKKGARLFYAAIKSAINNAKNTLKTNEDLLKFKLLTVEEGQKLKRFKPGGRGTAKIILRRFSHIKIILEAPTLLKKTVEKKIVTNKVKPEVKKTKVNKPKNGTKS
jgi:large subunit ribosomal protein L22